MQQGFIPPDHTTISPLQKRLMSILSGLLLTTVEFVLVFLAIFHFHINYFQSGPLTLIGIIALLYFVAPIPLSFYISRQTGEVAEGWKVGGMSGCTGALLAILITGIYILYNSGGSNGDMIFAVIPIVAFLNAFGALIGLLGAAIGSGLGKMGKIG